METPSPAFQTRELTPIKRAHPHFDDYVPLPLELTHQHWEWYPAAIQTMIHEERVPPPRGWDTVGGAPTLPVLLHPMDQAFAVAVARLDRREREVQFMREFMIRDIDTGVRDATERIDRLSEYTSKRFSTFREDINGQTSATLS